MLRACLPRDIPQDSQRRAGQRTSAPKQAYDDGHRGNPQPHSSKSDEVQAERNLEHRPRHHPSSESGQDESRGGGSPTSPGFACGL